jgi:hypothetical protein
MSPIQSWGPITWSLFHSLAEQIKDEDFKDLHLNMFQIIKRICNFLPCPECSKHATKFLSKIDIKHISCKSDFKGMLFCFHNVVNNKKNKSLFHFKNINIYSKTNILNTFKKFVSVYNTNGNMQLIADSFQRKLVINDVKSFLIKNIKSFSQNIIKSQINTQILVVELVVETVVEPVVETHVEQVVEPHVEPHVEPVVEPHVEPHVEPVVEPHVEPVFEPVVEPHVEPVFEPHVEPAFEPVALNNL